MTTRIEADLQDSEARTVTGVRGARSKSFSRKFANAAAMDRWLDADDQAGDVEVYSIERRG